MKAQKLPSGNWRARAYSHTENGKQKVVSFTAPTRAEAIRLAVAFMNDKERTASPQDLTVGECIERYIENKKQVLSPTTLREYVRQYKKGYFSIVSDIKLSRLSSADMQRVVNDLSATLSPKSVKTIYGLLSSSVKMFSDKNYKVTLPQMKPIERNIPIDEEINLLMEKANESMKLCIALASVGTLRRGEICGLKYKDVLPEQSAIYVHSDIVKGLDGEWIHKDMPKTSESVRFVKLPQEIMDMIGTGEPEEYVYKPHPDRISKSFMELRNSLGLKCRFHDLRHYAASVMHAIGIPDQYIMERGGWKSDFTLKKIYRNALSDKSVQFSDQANDYFSNALNIPQKPIS